jgi:hypothetical protein
MPSAADWIEAAGRLSTAFSAAPPTVGGALWRQLSTWVTRLSGAALGRWAPIVALGRACDTPLVQGGHAVRCGHPAVVQCMACGRLTCLGHALIDQTGSALCHVCTSRAVMAARGMAPSAPQPEPPPPPPPPPRDSHGPEKAEDKLRKAYETLGLAPGCTDAQLAKGLRETLARYHPDRVQEPEEKARVEKLFRRAQRAHAYILKRR